MISPSCDIREFIEAVRKKTYQEVLCLTDKEALEAWRLTHLQRVNRTATDREAPSYVRMLEGLMHFMRSSISVRPAGVSDDVFKDFCHLRQALRSPEPLNRDLLN